MKHLIFPDLLLKPVKLSDLPCLQNTAANFLNILEISSQEETCQIFGSKSTSDNKHRQFWWFPADNISPLAAGCESFTLSSSITLFLFIYRGGQQHPNHFHTYDYSHSFRATVWRGWQRLLWKVGRGVRWGEKTVFGLKRRVTTAPNSSLFRT